MLCIYFYYRKYWDLQTTMRLRRDMNKNIRIRLHYMGGGLLTLKCRKTLLHLFSVIFILTEIKNNHSPGLAVTAVVLQLRLKVTLTFVAFALIFLFPLSSY